MSKVTEEIRESQREGPIRKYFKKKYKWTEETFNTVNWEAIGRVRKKYKRCKYMQSCKILHDWLPKGHMIGHVTGVGQCPGCKHQGETLEHALCCPNVLVRNRAKIVAKVMEDKIKKLKIPGHIAQCWIDITISHIKQNL